MTTSILGDIVGEIVGDAASVEVVMPVGADPHEFAPSARQAEAIAGADLLVQNGAGFEAGMADVIDNAADEGSTCSRSPITSSSSVTIRTCGPIRRGLPPVWRRWARVWRRSRASTPPRSRRRPTPTSPRWPSSRSELDDVLAGLPSERRVLVTDHEVFGYFADRFDFEVVGTVIASTTTDAAPSAADLDALAATIRDAGVPAIFTESGHSDDLADALADEVGDVEIVALFAESLGGGWLRS